MNAAPTFSVDFGPAPAEYYHALGRSIFHIPLPWLDGNTNECLFPNTNPEGEAHGFQLRTSGDLLLGCATIPLDGTPLEVARQVYDGLLAASAGRSLYRIWNYVPDINGMLDGLENYRAFCIGRAQAFEKTYGKDFHRMLPAASAVGCSGDSLAVVFVAGEAAPRHVENPEQVAAYEYPPEYGARPPSFARATVATHRGRPLVFVSGTAAIKGHATVAPDSLQDQLDCTLDNLRLIGRATGLGDALGAASGLTRHFKVYLRDPSDIDEVRSRLARELLKPQDHIIYLQADICRAELKLEIEATVVG